jgi:hypothetical protein
MSPELSDEVAQACRAFMPRPVVSRLKSFRMRHNRFETNSRRVVRTITGSVLVITFSCYLVGDLGFIGLRRSAV